MVQQEQKLIAGLLSVKAKGGDKQSKSKEEARSDSKSKSAPIEKKTPKNPKKEPGKK